MWWPKGDTTPEGSKIEEITSNFGLSQLINEPTNFEPNKNPSCIDLIFTDQPNLVLECGTRPSLDSFCHHQITYCRFNFKIPPPPPFTRKIWLYDEADKDAIKRSVSFFPWEHHFQTNTDPSWQVKFFTDTILNIMSNFIPNKIIKVIPGDPPWINKTLKNMLNKQNRLFKKFKRHGFKPCDKIRVDTFRQECESEVFKAKDIYMKNIGNKLIDPSTSQKAYWKLINRVMNKCKAPKIPPLLVNNKYIINCTKKAAEFASFFSSQCKPIFTNSTFTYLTNERLNNIAFTDEEILLLIRSLNPNKSNGPDEISARMLLICDESIVLPLKSIFYNILSTGIYPDLWKCANVTPIHKKDSKQIVKNYRPISLLPICSKIFEKIVFKHIYNFFICNNLITKNQSGFRPGDSTVNQLIDLVNEIHLSFDNRKSLEVRAVFLDISKAFDKVWHDGLSFKLKQNGISGPLLNVLNHYLSNRKQRVVLNGFSSDYFSIEAGVPQGSVLGPLLFLIYINDLEVNIKSKVNFFADDTMIFSVVHDPLISASDLNHDLQNINTWAYQWKMSFNPDHNKQAVEMLFSQKVHEIYHPPLFFNNSIVCKVDSHKHLGLSLDPKLTFINHINDKIKAAKRSIGILKYLSKYLPLKTLDTMYKMFIRPHFDYCDTIYHIPHIINSFDNTITLNFLMERIEKIQYQAALAITGTWQGTSRNKLYDELGWESLNDRRWTRRLIQFYKIRNDMTPLYLKDNLPLQRRPLYRNNSNCYHEIPCNTTRHMNSFFPNSIKLWNGIGLEFKTCTSLGSFKRSILNLIRQTPKSIFGILDPLGLKRLFQLRVGLSPLKCHKYNHNFTDTPNDWCDCHCAPENIYHFLLKCPLFLIQRQNLILSVSNLLTNFQLLNLKDDINFYLYGHNSLPNSVNKNVLLSTISYINDTGRFL